MTDPPKPENKDSRKVVSFVIKETMVMGCLLAFGYLLFSHYRAKAQSDQALNRYISLGGYDLSYLQTYQYLLIFFWMFIGIAILAFVLQNRERWEIRDFKRMPIRQRNGKK